MTICTRWSRILWPFLYLPPVFNPTSRMLISRSSSQPTHLLIYLRIKLLQIWANWAPICVLRVFLAFVRFSCLNTKEGIKTQALTQKQKKLAWDYDNGWPCLKNHWTKSAHIWSDWGYYYQILISHTWFGTKGFQVLLWFETMHF